MKCPDNDTLLHFISGVLPDDHRDHVLEHLDQCPVCRHIVSMAVMESTTGMSAVPPGEASFGSLVPNSTVDPLVAPAPATEPPPENQLSPGEMVDHFKILRLLGRGGMGNVYLARDTTLGRKVALKLLRSTTASQQSSERFLREARIIARFNHPHIVVVHAVGSHEGSPYLALEYLEGETLQERMGRKQLTTREVLHVGLAVARALSEAHAHGVLHCDLKPANVIITSKGRICILDFGLAQAANALEPSRIASADQTVPDYLACDHARGIRGTPAYMAPEQWRMEEPTSAADLWALGVILFELVATQRPFTKIDEILRAKLPSLREHAKSCPPGLIDLIGLCLEKAPQRRPTAPEAVDIFLQLQKTHLVPGTMGPFRGLRAFSEGQAGLFFGREPEITAFLERLRDESVLPVVGPSGVGKSSLIQAGVIPRLKEQAHWKTLKLRPGPHPFEALANQLLVAERASGSPPQEKHPSDGSPMPRTDPSGRGHQQQKRHLAAELISSPGLLLLRLAALAETTQCNILLFVDQLEELCTQCADPALRRAFMRSLCMAADDPAEPVRVIFTLRDDFLWRLAEGPEPQEILGRVTVLRPPAENVLEEILTRSLAAVGYRFDDEHLVQDMIAEIRDTHSALPLLQFAGQMLWDQRDADRKVLTRQAYRDIGGVAGSLAKHADGVLETLAPDQVRMARSILLGLVTPDGTRKTRLKSDLVQELGRQGELVLERLTQSRTILTRRSGDDSRVELAHESLIHNWDRLSTWLEESREDRVFLAEMMQVAKLWDRRGRPADEVWQGDALHDALRQAARMPTLPEPVSRFLEAGRSRQNQRLWRQRLMVGASIGILLLIALVLFQKEREASRQELRAKAERMEAIRQRQKALQERAEALLEGSRAALARRELIEARAKLRVALETRDSPLARALWWQLKRSPLYWKKKLSSSAYDVAISPDGQTIAVGCQDWAVRLLDRLTGAERKLRRHKDQVHSVAFSPDGHWLASGSLKGELILWDLSSGESYMLPHHPGLVRNVRFSPDGRLLVSTCGDDTIRLWNVASRSLLKTFTGKGKPGKGVSFSPDSKLIAFGRSDGAVQVWRLSDNTQVILRGHRGRIWDVLFSPDGTTLASAGEDNTVRIWNWPASTLRDVLKGHADAVFSIAFSPDGKLLASIGRDSTVRLWDLAHPNHPETMPGQGSGFGSVAFSPNGHYLASVSDDKTLRIWTTLFVRGQGPLQSHQNGVIGIAYSPDGQTIASTSNDRTVRLWDVASAVSRSIPVGHKTRVEDVCFERGGEKLVSVSFDRVVRIWNLRTKTIAAVLRGHTGPVPSVEASRDGRWLASASYDRTVRIWRLPFNTVHTVLKLKTKSYDLAFSPDGNLLASTGSTLELWHVPTGRRRMVLHGHQGRVNGVRFGPRGRLLVSTGMDGTARVWNIATGAGRTVSRTLGRFWWPDFHPDGKRLGLPCSDGTARIVNIDSGKEIVLRGHRAEVNYLRFSPDGRLAATSSDDSTIRLWNVESGHPVWRAPLLRGSNSELFTHDGWTRLDGSKLPTGISTSKWRRAVEKHARLAVESQDGRSLCLATYGDTLERWDLLADALALRTKLNGLKQVIALNHGCITLAKGEAHIRLQGLPARLLRRKATAIGWTGKEILVAADRRVYLYDIHGRGQGWLTADHGITALAKVGAHVVAGYQDGSLELVLKNSVAQKKRLTFQQLPASPVVQIIPGPKSLLVAGFANGVFGLWSTKDGGLIIHRRMHGPVIHLHFEGQRLYAASELGQHAVLNLRTFSIPYCHLLRSIWAAVPVIWRGGLVATRGPPKDHPCRR